MSRDIMGPGSTSRAADVFAPSASSSSTTPTRPRSRSQSRRAPNTEDTQSTPAPRNRPHLAASSFLTTQTSPAYTTSLRSRHSLYGTEDRVVLDLGSRIWKVGFSGEGCPRECMSVIRMIREQDNGSSKSPLSLWGLEKADAGSEEWEIRMERLKRGMREIWFSTLMADPKARKVIVVENALLSIRVKEMIARILFDNLQVPSVSFASSQMLALVASGAVTGLVVDCGNLETTVLPIYTSRPLFPHVLSTPRAGARLTSRLRSLLLAHASYVPPPSSLNSTSPPTKTKVPVNILTEELVEEIKTRCCFVGEQMADHAPEPFPDTSSDEGEDSESITIRRLYNRFGKHSTATSLSFKVSTPWASTSAQGVGKGWLLIPGWVRERAAELLFEEGDEDDQSITDVILDSLLNLPIDLRKPLASTILITGGTAMMPGFFARLRAELLARLTAPAATPSSPPRSTKLRSTEAQARYDKLAHRLSAHRSASKYSYISALAPYISFLNDPSISSSVPPLPLPPSSGQAPPFCPSLLPWVGGSLAGALKTGGEEITRERWDSASEGSRIVEQGMEEGEREERTGFVLPDWTALPIKVL